MEKLLIIFASLLFTTCVYADTIYMKNGSTINNVDISKRNYEHIFFYTANGSEVVLPKSMIKRIESSKKNETPIDPTTLPVIKTITSNKEYSENSTDPKVVYKSKTFKNSYMNSYGERVWRTELDLPVLRTYTSKEYEDEYYNNLNDPKKVEIIKAKVAEKIKAIREGRGYTHYRKRDGTLQEINPTGYQDIRPNPRNCENHMILGNGASMHW